MKEKEKRMLRILRMMRRAEGLFDAMPREERESLEEHAREVYENEEQEPGEDPEEEIQAICIEDMTWKMLWDADARAGEFVTEDLEVRYFLEERYPEEEGTV